ncbi:MAG: DUF4349 domain-containing protein [Candidatus Eremiobacteraeota bacterium]|nr:DUF4349 domain-containing protein [Candidatus Eremiobacteraeota bacterium]
MKKVSLWIMLFFFCISACQVPAALEAEASKPRKRVVQTYINATVIASDLPTAAGRLTDMVKQHKGILSNLNIDDNSASGNASIQIPTAAVSSFLSDLKQVGRLQSQSMSTSDYSQSYDEYSRKLKAYELLAKASREGLFSRIEISDVERPILEAEFANLLKDQITSCRSSLRNYDNYGDNANVSIALKGTGQGHAVQQDRINVTEVKEIVREKAPSDMPASSAIVIALCVMLVAALLYLVVLYRKVQQMKDSRKTG